VGPHAKNFNPRPGILQIPVRAQENEHGTSRRVAAIDHSISPRQGAQGASQYWCARELFAGTGCEIQGMVYDSRLPAGLKLIYMSANMNLENPRLGIEILVKVHTPRSLDFLVSNPWDWKRGGVKYWLLVKISINKHARPGVLPPTLISPKDRSRWTTNGTIFTDNMWVLELQR